MKVLGISGYFLLPEDFNGDYTDALQEYVNYRKERAELRKQGKLDESIEIEMLDHSKDLWEDFLDNINSSDRKFTGEVSVSEFKDDEWNNFPLDK